MIPSLFALLLLQSTPAPPTTPAPKTDKLFCTAIVVPPAGLEAWSHPMGLSGVAGFMVGQATQIPLGPIEPAKLAIAPGRPPAPGTNAQTLGFHIQTAGTYRIALSDGAWIDVVRDGKSLESVAHTEGPTCSGIRKIVDFDLATGDYTLQLTGAKVDHMTVLVAPK